MKTRTIVEDVTGSRSRRYYAEVEDTELNIRRESDSVAEAARRVVDAVRYKADDAERKFVEAGILPKKADEPKVGTTLPDVLRSGKWFRRQSWSKLAAVRAMRVLEGAVQVLAMPYLGAPVRIVDQRDEDGRPTPYAFLVDDVTADDWELVPDDIVVAMLK